GQQRGCNDIGFVLLPDGRTYSIAVFVKDSEESFAENSKIIADISRIVYEYAMQSAK
ncbi:MAG: class A beta-lactamase, partial [Parabacteroides merdae]